MLDDNVKKAISPPGSPWWIYFYAKNTDSTYIVATNPNKYPGYSVIALKPYSQWLEDDQVFVYLLRKKGAPWPPAP
jgi:hypothetical protein